MKLGERMRLKFVADLFNLFDEQKVTRVNQFGEQNGSPGTADPDFLKPASSTFADPYQIPFQRPPGSSLRVLTRLARHQGSFQAQTGTSLLFL